MITRKQQELLNYMHQRLSQDAVPPSYEEMRDAMGLKSKSGIHRLISGLEERGYIRRLANRARAVEIIRLPGLNMQAPQTANQQVPPTQAPAAVPAPTAINGSVKEVSLYGRLGNNMPLEDLDEANGSIMVPTSFLDDTGDHLALEIVGEYMNGAGISTGDTVVIERCNEVENNTIVLASVDDSVATLKRFRRVGTNIVLDPANKVYVSSTYAPGRVKILGRLVSLLRKY